MQVFPATRSGRVNLLVFPFKAYILITLPIFLTLQGSTLGAALFVTYGFCAVPLLVGLIIQFFLCTRQDTAKTLLFFIPSLLILSWFCLKQVSHRRFVESEKWKTQTYEMDFDEVVRRVASMEQQSGGKWHWTQKQEDKPSNNILHSRLFVIDEHQSGADAHLDADISFQVSVWATETNKTKVTERTIKFGSNRDPNLHAQDLLTESNRISAVINAIRRGSQSAP